MDQSKYGEEWMDRKKRDGKLLIMLILDYIIANITLNDQTYGFGLYALINVLEKQNKNLFQLILILEKLPGSCFKTEHQRMNVFFNYRIFPVNLSSVS